MSQEFRSEEGHSARVSTEGGSVVVFIASEPGCGAYGTRLVFEKSRYNELWLGDRDTFNLSPLGWLSNETGLQTDHPLVQWVDYTLFAMGMPKRRYS